ncbi:hypothetical protein V6Z12_A10G094200 [Gossypium hirsutum]
MQIKKKEIVEDWSIITCLSEICSYYGASVFC